MADSSCVFLWEGVPAYFRMGLKIPTFSLAASVTVPRVPRACRGVDGDWVGMDGREAAASWAPSAWESTREEAKTKLEPCALMLPGE